jgi:hypothetical protein
LADEAVNTLIATVGGILGVCGAVLLLRRVFARGPEQLIAESATSVGVGKPRRAPAGEWLAPPRRDQLEWNVAERVDSFFGIVLIGLGFFLQLVTSLARMPGQTLWATVLVAPILIAICIWLTSWLTRRTQRRVLDYWERLPEA